MIKRIEIVLTYDELALAERLCAEENAERKPECQGPIGLTHWLGAVASAALVRRLAELADRRNRAEAPVLSAAPAAAD